jgi:hypothetical protein
MLKKLLILIIVSLTTLTIAFAQNPNESNPPGAREVMVKFVELNNKQLLQTDAARQLLNGDASEWKMAWFGEISASTDKILAVGKDFSVARVQTVQKNSRVVDLYFYLKFADGWKINSMRAMAQTGWLESAVETLKNEAAPTPEIKEILANAELTLSSDKTLTGWFQTNRLALKNLAARALVETKPKPEKVRPPPKIKKRRTSIGTTDAVAVTENRVDYGKMENDEPQTIERITAATQRFPKSAAALENLHFTALETKSDGSIEFTIGGVTDNTVGFIYSPKAAPPQIDGWRYIWVEKLAAGWYLFRTT